MGNPACPHCHSVRVIKKGFDRDRQQRYQCNWCYRRFTESTLSRVNCPHCGTLTHRHRFDYVKERFRYKCPNPNCTTNTFTPRPPPVSGKERTRKWRSRLKTKNTMNYKTCKTCAFFDPSPALGNPFGVCDKLSSDADSEDWLSQSRHKTNSLAYSSDPDDYLSVFRCQENFGCVLHNPRK